MRILLCCVAVLATACGDNRAAPRDPAPADDAAVPDAAAPAVRAACLDRPEELALAPTGALPCDLLPPGFGS